MPTITITANAVSTYYNSTWTSTASIDLRQGYYTPNLYWGHFWFSGTDLTTLRNTLGAGVAIDSVEMYFERVDTVHGSSAATTVKVFCSSKTTNSGSVGTGNLSNGISLGTFTRGQGKWCMITTTQLQHLLDGYNGFCTYVDGVSTSGEYSYFVRSTVAPQLRVTYHTLGSTGSLNKTSVDAGTAITLNISANSSSFTHSLTWAFGSNTSTQSLSAGVASSAFTPPLAWLSAIPNSTSGQAGVTLYTYSGGSLIGSAYYTFTITAPSSVAPRAGSLTATRIDGTVATAWAVYVQGMSKATVSISGAAGIYGSTITGYTITGGGSSGTASSLTTGFLNTSGTVTFTGTVTDSRGRSSSATLNITVYEYGPPTFSVVQALRANSSGVATDEGTYLRAMATFACSSVNGKNSVTGKVQYRKGATGSLSAATNLPSGTAVTMGAGALTVDDTWEALFTLTDALGSVTRVEEVGSTAYTMHFKKGGNGVAFGKASETVNAVEVASTWAFYAGGKNLAALTPALIGAAPAVHAHAIADTTGTLAVNRGGTGATDAATARANLGVTLANLGGAAASHNHDASNITAGTVNAARLPFKVAYGSTSINGNTASYISYAGAGFTSVPCIFCDYSTTGVNWSGDNGCIKIYAKTSTGANIIVGGTFATNRDVDWFAIGT